MWVCMCASPKRSQVSHATRTGNVCACQRGMRQFSSNSRMYFRLASVKLKVRLPTCLGPACGCLCLMTRVCRSPLRACPSPSVRYHGVLRVYLCTCQATLCVQFSVCLTAAVPNASEQHLSCSDSGPCSSGQRLSVSDTGSCATGLCVSQ